MLIVSYLYCCVPLQRNENSERSKKIAKYDELASTHIFYPVAIENGGTWNHWAVCPANQQTGRNNHWRT